MGAGSKNAADYYEDGKMTAEDKNGNPVHIGCTVEMTRGRAKGSQGQVKTIQSTKNRDVRGRLEALLTVDVDGRVRKWSSTSVVVQASPATEFPKTADEWSEKIVSQAKYYTVSTRAGVGRTHTTPHSTLQEAATEAGNRETRLRKPLVYAVASSGRSAVVPEAQWRALLEQSG